MQALTTLGMEASADMALKDTQEDEYYGNATPDGIRNAAKLLRENPYPGLRPFKTSEAHVFFGRKDITLELISRLAQNRFLPVLGASGSGKSSLVRAGLLPGLKSLPGKHGLWKIAICRPGNNPFGNLAVAISKAGFVPSLSTLQIWQSISSSSYGFEEMYGELAAAGDYNTIIVIDQFEEMFRFKKDNGISGKNDSAIFVKMLIDITRAEKLNTYVMITMRSDYLGDCIQFPELVEEINRGQFLVPRLKFNQLREAIVEPAGFSNAWVDPVFADKLIGDIGDDMDQLPVLQHALSRAYEEAKQHKAERNGIKVTFADYDASGRMENALDQHAKEITKDFSEGQKKYCKILFQCITDRTSDGRGIRRPLTLETIYKICIEAKAPGEDENKILEDLKKVIECFRKDGVNFLMPPQNVPLQERTEIDISHESLMRIWRELIKWTEEEAGNADLLRLLLNMEGNESIRGGKLLSYQNWAAAKKGAVTWAGMYKPPHVRNKDYVENFSSKIILINKNVEDEKTELAAKETEQKRLLKEAKEKAKRRLNYIFLFIALFGVVLAASIILLNLNHRLDQNKKNLQSSNERLKNQNDTIHQQVAVLNKLNNSLTENKVRLDSTIAILSKNKSDLEAQHSRIASDSALLSIKNDTLNARLGQLRKQKKYSDSLYNSLAQTNKDLNTTFTKAQNLQNLALAVKHAEKSLAIPIYDSSRNNIKAQLALVSYQLLLQSGKEEAEKLQPQIYSSLYNAIKSTNADDEQLAIITPYKNNTDRVSRASFSNNQNNHTVIHLSAEDKNIYSFDLQNRKINTTVAGNGNKKTVFAIDADRQGNWLAINTLDSILLVKDLLKNNTDTLVFKKAVRCATFSPDGKELFVYTRDKFLYHIDLNNMQQRYRPAGTKIEADLQHLAISNTFLYGVTSYGNIVKWNRKNGSTEKSFLTSQPDSVSVPKNNKGELYRGTAVGCSANDDIVVWGNEHGEVFYYSPGRSRTGQNLTRFGGPVTDIAFSESGNYLAVSSFDKSVKIFQLPDVQAAAPIDISKNEGAIMSISFQRDAKTNAENLIAVMNPGIVRIFPMNLNELSAKLKKMVTKDITPLERKLYFDAQVQDSLIEKYARDKN